MDQDQDMPPSSTTTKPMTPEQAKYLEALAARAGEHFDPDTSSAEATKLIARLQKLTGRKPKVILSDDQNGG